jgi:hypothetical protein
MNHPAFAPIQNTSLPREFRYIRLERARDHDHPEGYGKIAYILIAPLDAESKIDASIWRSYREASVRTAMTISGIWFMVPAEAGASTTTSPA